MGFENQILIIDDNVDLCHNLRDTFEDKDYLITMAHTGDDGLAALRQQPFHTTLLDIRLPDGQGSDLLSTIYQLHPDMPIIIITAYGSLETAMQALHLGAYDYIMKPLDMDKVLAIVDRAVEKAHLVQQERQLTRRLRQELAERRRVEVEREQLIAELQDALAKVKVLSGILPICANCKKIRDDHDYWHDVAVYIRDHSEAEFTHGLCPNCIKQLYPDYCQDE